jgi:hypothetical protein
VQLVEGFPEVPLPSFAGSVEEHSENPWHLERFFIPKGHHPLEDVRTFYGEWTEQAGWRKLDPSEERWSIDSWVEFRRGKKLIRQYQVHWADASGKWSLRLAMRSYAETGNRDAWAIVEPFFSLDGLPLPGS